MKDLMSADVEELLDELRRFVDNYVDVNDGDDGQPRPNAAMQLNMRIDHALGNETRGQFYPRGLDRLYRALEAVGAECRRTGGRPELAALIEALAAEERRKTTESMRTTMAWHTQQEESPMNILLVLVPVAGSRPATMIDPGSGIVAADRPGESLRAYYEGNRYDAENLRTFNERVLQAAGRLIAKYPTIAFGAWAREDFVQVGTFRVAPPDWRNAQLTITDQARLDEWLGGRP